MKHSLLRQNISLLLGLAIVSQTLTGLFLLVLVQKPRLDAVINFALHHVTWVESSLAQLSPAQRQQLVGQINGSGYLHLQQNPPDQRTTQAAPELLRLVFKQRLPEPWHSNAALVTWQTTPNTALWLQLSPETGGYWARLDLQRLEILPSGVWAWVFLCSMLISLAGAILIQRRINRPLRTLVTAAEAVGQGKTVQLNATDLPPEIATVANSFNVMQTSLAQAEQARNVMLAGVSHDLRTPLTKVRLGLELLPTTDPDLQQRMIRDIETINQQLGQFMDFARADVAETAVDADLNELVHYLVTPLREQGSRISLQLGELPIFAFPPQSIARVLQNLIENALKYADDACEIHTYAANVGVYVDVLDSGKGLTAAELARIKQPFVRGDQTQHKAGSGLGLTIVERILHRSGGSLHLQNRQGGGLQAQVRLPLAMSCHI